MLCFYHIKITLLGITTNEEIKITYKGFLRHPFHAGSLIDNFKYRLFEVKNYKFGLFRPREPVPTSIPKNRNSIYEMR